MSSATTSAVTGAPAAAAPAVKATTAKPTAASKKAQAAPAPGVKNVRAAYSGKGWYVNENMADGSCSMI